MSYVGMRLYEGATPYVDVHDMNMPGTYLIHLALYAMTGTNALVWRLLDIAVALVGAWATYRLVRPLDAPGAAVAAVATIGYHQMHGAYAVGERDFWVAVLAVAGSVAALKEDEGRVAPGRMALAGALVGYGCTIKPVLAVFGLILAAVTALAARDRGEALASVARDLALLAAGAAVAGGLPFAWVIASGGGPGLSFVLSELMPVHTGLTLPLAQQTKVLLLEGPVWLVPLALIAPMLIGPKHRARRVLLVLGTLYGLTHWYAQGKAWDYHAHPLAYFALAGAASAWRLPRERLPHQLAALAATVLVPCVLLWDATWAYKYVSDDHVERLRLGAEGIAAHVTPDETIQIIGDVGSGIQTLADRAQPMATPWVYDFHFYERHDEPEVQAWRGRFLDALREAHPDVIVLSIHSWPDSRFERLEHFPTLQAFLDEAYQVAEEGRGWKILRPRATP